MSYIFQKKIFFFCKITSKLSLRELFIKKWAQNPQEHRVDNPRENKQPLLSKLAGNAR